jgi:hypothetical protein
VPPVFTPQLWNFPALTAMKVALGGLACPSWLSPQQARVASVLTAQLCASPALMAVKFPLGGLACPSRSSPQQARVPSIFSPQACVSAARALRPLRGLARCARALTGDTPRSAPRTCR